MDGPPADVLSRQSIPENIQTVKLAGTDKYSVRVGAEQAMGANDWLICRLVCGENHTVADAVQAIGPGYKFSTLARFREALDALASGMKEARRGGRA
jgi:hypothetical protein